MLTGKGKRRDHKKTGFQFSVLGSWLFTLVFCLLSSDPALARTDVFFLAPVSGSVDEEVAVQVMVKGEGLQSAAFDVLIDTRYVEPVTVMNNQVKLEPDTLAQVNPTYFFMAAVLSDLYDETRAYLRTVRVAFAFQGPVNTTGVEPAAKLYLRLLERPADGYVTLPVISDGAKMAEFVNYRQGGGVILFSDPARIPEIDIVSPENELRYEETEIGISVSANATDGGPLTSVFWWDPFNLVDPADRPPLVFEGTEGTLTFSPGIHAFFCLGMDADGNWGGTWTVFGHQEDVIVSILGAIHAFVVEAVSGLPVSTAVVSLSRDDRILTTCMTGEDGLCMFEGLDEGTYDLTAHKDAYEGTSAQVFVPQDETITVQLRILALTTPSGDYYEYGIYNICVREGSKSGPFVPDAQVREMRGTYSCRTDLTGCCRIVRIRQELDYYWTAHTDELFSEITGPERMNTSEQDLVLTVNRASGTGIRLEVKDAFSLSPVPSLDVDVLIRDEEVLNRTTDATGTAILTPLAVNQAYTLSVRTAPSSGPDGTTWQAGQDLDISYNDLKDGKILPIRLPFRGHHADLQPATDTTDTIYSTGPATLDLTVMDTAKTPLSRAVVRVRQGEFTSTDYEANGSGLLTIQDLWPGTYDISVSKDGYQGVEFSLTLGAGQTKERFIKLAPALDPQIQTEVLPSEDTNGTGDGSCPALAITVINPYTASPVPDISVEVFQFTDGLVVRSGTTDSEGKYLATGLADLHPLAVRLINPKIGDSLEWTEIRELGPVNLGEGLLTKYSFYMNPGATDVLREEDVQGENPILVSAKITLQDENSQPLSNEEVRIESPGDGSVFDLETDGRGIVTFTHDFPGAYCLTAVPPGIQGMSFTTTLVLGQEASLTLTLPRIPTIMRPQYEDCAGNGSENEDLKATLTVIALNANDGLPMADVSVRFLDPKDGHVSTEGTTGPDGVWEDAALSPGTGILKVSWPSSGNWMETQTAAGIALIAGHRTTVTVFPLPNATMVADTNDTGGDTDLDSMAEIHVQVLDTYGKGIPNIEISLINSQGRIIRRAFTGDEGRGALTRVNPGLYSVGLNSDDRASMTITGVDLWPGNHLTWTAVLPSVWDPAQGSQEEGPAVSQIRALVLNGESFRPIAGASGAFTDPAGETITDLPDVKSDSTGRLTLENLDDAGPVFLTLRSNAYRPRCMGNFHLQENEIRYELWTLTPNAALIPVGNPDRIPTGKTLYLPAIGQAVVLDDQGLTIFSYDPVRMEMRSLTRADLPAGSPQLLGAELAPFGVTHAFSGQPPYLIAVKVAPTTIILFAYQPESGHTLTEAGRIQTAGEILNAVMGYDTLAIASPAGVFLYRFTGPDGTLTPSLASHLNLPAMNIIKSGTDFYVLTPDGQVVGLDVDMAEMPLVTGQGPVGYAVRHAATSSPSAMLADDLGSLHPVRFLNVQSFGSPSGSTNRAMPQLLANGMSLNLNDLPKELSALSIDRQIFGQVLTDKTIYQVEITDNVPMQMQCLPMPGTPRDVFPIRQRINEQWSAALMVSTEAGFFTIPLPEKGQDTVHISVDMTTFLPTPDQTYRVWTAQGFTGTLIPQTDSKGQKRYVWETDLPAGIYDIAVVAPNGRPVLTYYNASLFTDANGTISRIIPLLATVRADHSLSASFSPGDEAWLRVGLDVWNPPLCDVHLLLDYSLNSAEDTWHGNFVTAQDGTMLLVPWGGTADDPVPLPLVSTWPATPLRNSDLPFLILPHEGGYAGAGTVSIVFTKPGGHPIKSEDVRGKAMTSFRIKD